MGKENLAPPDLLVFQGLESLICRIRVQDVCGSLCVQLMYAIIQVTEEQNRISSVKECQGCGFEVDLLVPIEAMDPYFAPLQISGAWVCSTGHETSPEHIRTLQVLEQARRRCGAVVFSNASTGEPAGTRKVHQT